MITYELPITIIKDKKTIRILNMVILTTTKKLDDFFVVVVSTQFDISDDK